MPGIHRRPKSDLILRTTEKPLWRYGKPEIQLGLGRYICGWRHIRYIITAQGYFIKMINDCRAGKIDLIVTKSVSRFARNIIDCIGYVGQLKAADPSIGVFFETENIFTLDENSEMSLSFIATLAQEESHTKSEIMNASIEMRFKRGIFLTPVLLGYDNDEDGNLVINEDEAKTVRLIFFSYLYGYSTAKIADALTELERLTKRGNQIWSSGRVLQIFTNERYCGDVLARKKPLRPTI